MTHKPMKRRQFIKNLAAISAATATTAFAAPAIASGKREWKMAMTWQKELPGLGTGAVRLAKRITDLSGGKLEIKVYGSGELVPPQQVFDAVSEGEIELGHSASYYWLSKNRACTFFCAVPGGLTAQEQNGWLYFGGGQTLWDELYAGFNLKPFPAGNTGVQMGGWFKREIHSLSDIKGFTMRMPGIAGEVWNKLGGISKTLPPQELVKALQTGTVEGVEWIGPWNDMALGLHRVANYYYGPAFQEGGPTLELMVNKKAYEELPKELQLVIQCACAAENDLMAAEYYANNITAFQTLRDKEKVDIRVYPEDVLKAFFKTSEEVVAEIATLGDINKRIYESYAKYRKYSMEFSPTAERGYLNARAKI